ncbi:MAG: threonine/serine exporter family protein [Lachnospiraceae bacterium]|nr:threonine/serine exporter family protein [Lachnospiraceae bacterium]
MRDVIQTIMGMIGAVGFATLFHVRINKLWACALGGGLSWVVYLVVLNRTDDKAFGLLASTLTVGFLAEILARVLKTPVTILLVPMLIPLIPGGDLYYTTSYLVRDMAEEFAESLNLVIREAGAIAFGIIMVTCFVQVTQQLYNRFKVSK